MWYIPGLDPLSSLSEVQIPYPACDLLRPKRGTCIDADSSYRPLDSQSDGQVLRCISLPLYNLN